MTRPVTSACQRRRSDADKTELIDRAIVLAQGGQGDRGPPHDRWGDLLRAYYRHVALEDLVDRTDVDVYGAFASHYKLAVNRPQGTARCGSTRRR